MEQTHPDLPDFTTYTRQNICDNTLDDAQLVTPCPLDNGRYTDASMSARHSAGHLDRRAVMQDLAGSRLPKLDKTTREPQRFVAIITAPHLFDFGRQADWGYFCLGCKEEKGEETMHFRIKYTREEVSEHIARYGPVKETPMIPGRFMHVSQV